MDTAAIEGGCHQPQGEVVVLDSGELHDKNRSFQEDAVPGPQKWSPGIDNKEYIADLRKLKELRSFLIEQAVQLRPGEDTLSFGTLNLLRYELGGRSPTQEEWDSLENLTQELFRHLDDPLRRRFLSSRLPWWVPQFAAVLGCVAILSLIGCTLIWGAGGYNRIIPFYLLWLCSLGAIGSISFLGMNALSVQDDATFDLTNTKLLVLRITLGSLFGVVLALPFGFDTFTDFIGQLLSPTPTQNSAAGLTVQTLKLLLPFILGFSTSLVIMILNRFVEAVETFFGRKTDTAPTATSTKSGVSAAAAP
jgi:hypothetical protein